MSADDKVDLYYMAEVGFLRIDWEKRTLELDGFHGHSELSREEVVGRLNDLRKRPKDPNVYEQVVVMWDCDHQISFFDAQDVFFSEPAAKNAQG